MADFKFNCPHCKQPLEAPREMLGQQISCPSCNGSLKLPNPQSQKPAVAPPPPLKQTKQCPFCGEDILVVTIKCRHCGSMLDGSDKPPLRFRPVEQPVTGTRRCPGCGAEVGGDDTWCGMCGMNLKMGRRVGRMEHSDCPALWNPNAAANWSLVFSPAFGAWIHAANWRALGNAGKAAVNMGWFYTAIVFLVINLLAAVVPVIADNSGIMRLASFVILLAWYFGVARSQVKYVKSTLDVYERRPWGKPLGLGTLLLVAYLGLAAVLPSSSIFQASDFSYLSTFGSAYRSSNQENACIHNLLILESGKEQCGLQEGWSDGKEITPGSSEEMSVLRWVKGEKMPTCPAGGRYELRPIGQQPICSIHGVRGARVAP